MISIRKLANCGMAAAVFATISIFGDAAYSADCLPDLTKAETRWDRLRDEKPMTIEFKREVTSQLTLAAELRHQGWNDKCLEETKKAMKEMDLAERR